jgi:hypothetical protein
LRTIDAFYEGAQRSGVDSARARLDGELMRE